MNFKYIFLLIAILNFGFSSVVFAKNRLEKPSLKSVKDKKMQDENVGTNVSFYKAMAKDISRHYKLEGKEVKEQQQITAAGSNIVQAGDNSKTIIINEIYAPQTNIAIGNNDSVNGESSYK